jgi:hypothetical protein
MKIIASFPQIPYLESMTKSSMMKRFLEVLKDWFDRAVIFLDGMIATLRRHARYATALRDLADEAWMVREAAEQILRRGGREALPWVRRGLKSKNPEVRSRAEELFEQINHFSEGQQRIWDALSHYKVLFVNPEIFSPAERESSARFFKDQWGYTVVSANELELITLIDRKFIAWRDSIVPPIPSFLQHDLADLRREIDKYLPATQETLPPLPEEEPIDLTGEPPAAVAEPVPAEPAGVEEDR